jgi:hypothetical protein
MRARLHRTMPATDLPPLSADAAAIPDHADPRACVSMHPRPSAESVNGRRTDDGIPACVPRQPSHCMGTGSPGGTSRLGGEPIPVVSMGTDDTQRGRVPTIKLFTIGYGGRAPQDFVALLTANGIKTNDPVHGNRCLVASAA